MMHEGAKYNWLIFSKVKKNIADSLNPRTIHCQVCRGSQGMCKNLEGFFVEALLLLLPQLKELVTM